jgi:hypothetical protein
MPLGMTNDQVDKLVLEVLRAIARRDIRATMEGKPVRAVVPLYGQCVYKLVAFELVVRDVRVDTASSTQYRLLADSMRRLIDEGLLFNRTGKAIEDRTFWVVIE